MPVSRGRWWGLWRQLIRRAQTRIWWTGSAAATRMNEGHASGDATNFQAARHTPAHSDALWPPFLQRCNSCAVTIQAPPSPTPKSTLLLSCHSHALELLEPRWFRPSCGPRAIQYVV